MRRLGLMLLCLAGFLAAVAAINWIVNPYGAWSSTVIDPAYRFTAGLGNEAGERVTHRLSHPRRATDDPPRGQLSRRGGDVHRAGRARMASSTRA